MKIYLIGTLFLLAVHQAAAQGLFGPSAGGGGEPAEGAGGAGGEGGTGAGGGLAALLGGAGGGGGGEPAEGGATRNPMNNLLAAYMLEQRMQQPQRPGMLQGLGRGRPRIHDQFSWTGALMRAYVLDRVIDKIKSFDWSELFS